MLAVGNVNKKVPSSQLSGGLSKLLQHHKQNKKKTDLVDAGVPRRECANRSKCQPWMEVAFLPNALAGLVVSPGGMVRSPDIPFHSFINSTTHHFD
uniref:Uncharacterized protein n=1 Tax=Globodera rostochiensis TaxID=31243 RepID=A0A914H9B4_GLORO